MHSAFRGALVERGLVERGLVERGLAYEAYAAVLPCVPFPGALGGYDCPFEPAFIQKRNERERQRVRCVNEGYARLRGHLPGALAEKRLSKVETLRAAIRYIKYLQELLSVLQGLRRYKAHGRCTVWRVPGLKCARSRFF
nr:achaete-scute homolog 5 [Vulpes vulpes]